MINIQLLKIQAVKERGGLYNLESKKIGRPQDAYNIINEVFEMQTQAEEILVLLALDTKNKVVGAFEVSRGSLNSSIVHPREIYKRALTCNAASIVIGHNHPSGDPAPSSEDINITNRLKECGKMLGIELLDHVIIGDNNYISLKERGLL